MVNKNFIKSITIFRNSRKARKSNMIFRRDFFGVTAAALQAKQGTDTVVGSATYDRTPRAGLLLSSFAGGQDHFGNAVEGLAEPRPVDASLTTAQRTALLSKAAEFCMARRQRVRRMVEEDEWALVQVASGTDPLLLESVLRYMAENGWGGRISVSCAWAGLAALSKLYPKVRFEQVDLATQQRIEIPAPRNGRLHRIPKVLSDCDRVIAVAPLRRGSPLSVGSYASLESKPDDAATVDLFSYHPPEFIVIGTANIVLVSMNAVWADTVAYMTLGIPQPPLLNLADKRSMGDSDPSVIWVRGNEPEEAQKALGY
jgi:hypothetical protein